MCHLQRMLCLCVFDLLESRLKLMAFVDRQVEVTPLFLMMVMMLVVV